MAMHQEVSSSAAAANAASSSSKVATLAKAAVLRGGGGAVAGWLTLGILRNNDGNKLPRSTPPRRGKMDKETYKRTPFTTPVFNRQRRPPPPAQKDVTSSRPKILAFWEKNSTLALAAATVVFYVVYPIVPLLLFRIPEQLSWLGLFQHSHSCSGTLHRHWNACMKLYAAHGIMIFPWLSAMWLWWKSSYPKLTKVQVTAAAMVLGILTFKASVDHWLLYQPDTSGELPLQGKVALITGANRGIGLATALALGRMGAHVVVTCRSLAKCQPVLDQFQSLPGSAHASVLDLSSLESAARLTYELSELYPEIHYIFCNAGTTPRHGLTAEGLEDAFGGMYLAHMAVVLGLLPNLERAGSSNDPARVVLVSSEMAINAVMGIFGNHLVFSSHNHNTDEDGTSTHTLEEDLADDWRGEITRGDGTIGPSLPAYGRAKLCAVLFALELNRRLERHGSPVIAHAVHTGAVVTDSSRDSIVQVFPRWIPGLQWIVGNLYFPLLWRHAEGGARALLCPALSREPYILQGGQYLDALCRPFQHNVDPNVAREKETTITLPSFLWGGSAPHTLQVDPVQALLLADIRWSERLWNVSLAFLEDSPAKSVVEYAP